MILQRTIVLNKDTDKKYKDSAGKAVDITAPMMINHK
jgi:hypothetical protein